MGLSPMSQGIQQLETDEMYGHNGRRKWEEDGFDKACWEGHFQGPRHLALHTIS